MGQEIGLASKPTLVFECNFKVLDKGIALGGEYI